MSGEYLTVEEALEKVLASVSVLPAESIPLIATLDKVLAEDIFARDSLPPFANSSMDGYAVQAEDTRQQPVTLTVLGDIAAGQVPEIEVVSGSAARIMTGAPMPAGADAVIPVEDTNEPWRSPDRRLPKTIEIRRTVKSGDYVRLPGEDIQDGALVIAAGTIIRPQEIGVMASLGVTDVPVFRTPKVGILATGDELVEVEADLTPGKIRNSNAYTQAAQVSALGAIPIMLGVARDTEEDVQAKLEMGVDAGVDMFISSAGVSVGAYDVVKSVLETRGKVGFWQVRMRPGKPLAQGTYQGIPYLGLPGNPVSAAVSFERFARPAILKLSGHRRLLRPEVTATLTVNMTSDGRESYIRSVVERTDNGYIATPTGSQGSHIMTSLVKANGLIIIPEGVTDVAAGDALQAIMIDWPNQVF